MVTFSSFDEDAFESVRVQVHVRESTSIGIFFQHERGFPAMVLLRDGMATTTWLMMEMMSVSERIERFWFFESSGELRFGDFRWSFFLVTQVVKVYEQIDRNKSGDGVTFREVVLICEKSRCVAWEFSLVWIIGVMKWHQIVILINILLFLSFFFP